MSRYVIRFAAAALVAVGIALSVAATPITPQQAPPQSTAAFGPAPVAFDPPPAHPALIARAVAPEISPTPSPEPAPQPTRQQAPAPKPPAGPTTIKLAPVTALADQSVIDQGHLVTWWIYPPCVLAGHDTDGWHWLSSIATGTIVEVTTGPCVGRYQVVAHHWESTRGTALPDALLGYDLALQTCVRSGGTGFSLANRL